MNNIVEYEWKYRVINIAEHLYHLCFCNEKQEAVILFNGIYIWNYLPDYKKIRIYISYNNIDDIVKQLLYRKISFEKGYCIEKIQDNVYNIKFSDMSEKS